MNSIPFTPGRAPLRGFLFTIFLLAGTAVSQLLAQPSWSFDVNDYVNSCQVYAVVEIDGIQVDQGYFGAFVGDECRGFTEGGLFPVTGSFVFSFLVHSNASSGEMLSFRYFDDVAKVEYAIEQTIEFVSDGFIGVSDEFPFVFTAVENAAPVADCPDKTSLEPAPGPITFDFCAIFSDPDGDELIYNYENTGGSVVWTSPECALEFTPEADGVSTLRLIASDGEFTAECNYSFTTSSTNNPPVVSSPIGLLKLDEGFGSLNIDLDTVFNDPDGDLLSYSAVSGNESIISVGLSGSKLTITEVAPGNTTLTISASDADFTVEDISDAVIFASVPAPPWKPEQLNYDGQIDAIVMINDALATSGVLAAFVGDVCVGVAESSYFQQTDTTLFFLKVFSSAASGDMLTFRFYDTAYNKVSVVNNIVPFKANMRLGSAVQPYLLSISADNHLPAVVKPVPDQTENERFGSVSIDLTQVFDDADGDVLEYSACVEPEGVVTADIAGGNLVITEAGIGSTSICVTAGDGTFSSVDRFQFTVLDINDPPVIENPVDDQVLDEGFGSKQIDISDVFTDPEQGVLIYSVSSSDETVVLASLSGARLVITEAGIGTSTVSLCVNDGDHTVCDEIAVEVVDINIAPQADCQMLKDTSAVEGFETFTLDFCAVFTDPDGNALSYSASSSLPGVATASLNGCELTISEMSPGTTTVNLCADDGEFETCCSFDFTVEERNEMEVYHIDQLLNDGDSIKSSHEAFSETLVIYSDVDWNASTSAAWISLSKINAFNLDVTATENTAQNERSGVITITDAQNNDISLVVYQTGLTSVWKHYAGRKNPVKIYPNPVDHRLYFDMESADPDISAVKIIDPAGRVFSNLNIERRPGETISLDMSDYPPGFYFVKIHMANNQEITLPVVKK